MGILTRLAVIWVAGVNYFFLPKVLIVAGHMGGDRAGVVRHSERQRAERWSQRRLVRRPARGPRAARARRRAGVGVRRTAQVGHREVMSEARAARRLA